MGDAGSSGISSPDAPLCSVGLGRKAQRNYLESGKRGTALECSVAEEQKVVGMTKRKCPLLEMELSTLRKVLALVN